MTTRHDGREAGSALYLALVATLLLFGLTFALVTESSTTTREYGAALAHTRRHNVAEAGLCYAMLDLAAGGSGDLGTGADPVSFGPGEYRVWASEDEEGRTVLTSVGTVAGASRALMMVLEKSAGAFHHAMFAGNSSRDPDFTINLGGVGGEADVITGDLFSGGDIRVEGDALVTGKLRASGEIYGGSGESGIRAPTPDVWQVDFETNHDIDVAAEFEAQAVYGSSPQGGDAWQVPEELPSHIFRLNPSDRKSEYESTAKNDYFLEDTYEDPLSLSNDSPLSLSGVDSNPGENGNRVSYFIDGNLWLHGKKTLGYQFTDQDPDGVQVTFIVKGNVYFSDNLTLAKPNKDGVAFIAIRDKEVANSGNVFFGDPRFGTLELMQAFMYAEDTFYDNNLDESGSAVVQVDGIMSAGNHVSINRDYDEHHSKLTLNFDDRVKKGLLELPGLPQTGSLGTGVTLSEVSCQEVSAEQVLADHGLGGN
jgi:hypothetical protein